MQKHVKKLEDLKEKKSALQEQEDKIKAEILEELSETLMAAQAIEIDFYTLVGGILDVIEKAKNGSKDTEVWKQAGERFFRARAKKKNGKVPISATTVEKGANLSK